MTGQERNEDGGYGGANLVGSSTSGTRAARESREALDAARERGARQEHEPSRGSNLGRLARAATPSVEAPNADAASGTGTLGETVAGTRASAGERDAERDSRDGGDSLQR